MIRQWSLAFLLTFISSSTQLSTPDSPSYIGAVVEYSPTFIPGNGPQTIHENCERYVDLIKQASEQNADIIVFAEDGLTTVHLPPKEEMDSWTTIVPAASENYTPCTQDTIAVGEMLKKLSCAARDYKIYVLVNLGEKVPSDSGTVYHNTNVVFDRNGKIIARYRKVHLFHEIQFSVTEEAEIVTFETDFGVTFGTFTCFDISHKVPGLVLTRERHITDILFPTAWYSEGPFTTSLQCHSGWAYAEDVNFLVSSVNEPSISLTGSGIYLGRLGTAKSILPQVAHTELLVAEIPKKHRTSDKLEHSGPYQVNNTYRYPLDADIEENLRNSNLLILKEDLSKYVTVPFTESIERDVCHDGFCCHFNVQVSHLDPGTKYHLTVINGIRTFGRMIYAGMKVCSVLECLDDSTETCISFKKSETTFSSIEITTTLDEYDNAVLFISAVDNSLIQIPNWTYHDEKRGDNQMHIVMKSNEPVKNLYAFSIVARILSRDVPFPPLEEHNADFIQRK